MKRAFYIGRDRRLRRGAACPCCANHLTGATAISEGTPLKDRSPKPGDATICVYCGAELIFTRSMRLRLANARERREIDAIPATKTFLMAQAAVSGKKPS